MSDLLPCPFCGGEAYIEQAGTRRQSCIIACQSCGCRHEGPDEEAQCGHQWNTRHTPEGWQLVPKEQTLEMQHAYFAVVDRNMQRMQTDCRYGRYANASVAYREMLAAAPKPEAGS